MSEDNENEIDTVLVSTVQSGKFADANICMAKMTSENDESLSFDNKTAVFCIYPPAGKDAQHVEVSAEGFVIANNIPTESAITDSSTIHVNTTTADSVYVSILVPEGLTIGSLSFSDGTNVKSVTTGAPADKEIAAGTLYTVTNANWESTEADIPDGALKGVFSVSADKQVYFSQGNLYAKNEGSPDSPDWKWHFYDEQYKYYSLSTGSSRTAADTDIEIDLFTWGYNATNSVKPIGTEYVSGHDTEGNKQLNPSTGGDDWGVAYCGSNGIDVGTWRTLSTAEWKYLFSFSGGTNYDNDTRRGRYIYGVTVCGKTNCVVLLPDVWEETVISLADFASTTVFNDSSNPTWQEMEDAGAVCLPAAGRRNGSLVSDVGNFGYYWSSTAFDSGRACRVNFDSSKFGPDFSGYRYYGYSVRLVTDVSAAPAPTAPAYVEITAKYDGEDQPARALKWATKNLAITDSGNKPWKGDNTSGAVKVPGTNEDAKVGDYFQWAASYGGYNVTENQEPDSLLIYTLFTNTGCGDDKNEFAFIGSKQFNQANAPYGGTSYTKYTSSGEPTLEPSDDVASIILGGTWRMPTSVEFKALKDATYWKWEDGGYYVYDPQSDDAGKINDNGTGTYDKSNALLFFPAAGYGNYTELNYAGTCGGYCSSTFNSSGMTNYAYRMEFNSDDVNPQYEGIRSFGFSVRPVSD